MPDDVIRSIQGEYFKLLQDDPLIRQCDFVDDKHFSIPSVVHDKHQVVARTRTGWTPAVVAQVEHLFDNVQLFWTQNSPRLRNALCEQPASSIHIDDLGLRESAQLYLPFFDRLLVSDQLLMLRQDYRALDKIADWQQLVISVIQVSMNILRFKPLFLPENGPPLAVILPATITLDAAANTGVTAASEALTKDFLSQLLDRNFTSFDEYTEYVLRKNPQEPDLDPKCLAALFGKYGATNMRTYNQSIFKTVYRDLGADWVARERQYRVLLIDILGRLREFERFGLDAATVYQQSEIERRDLLLFEWWFEASARAANRSLGLGFSEDFLFKAAPQSPELGFLRGIPLTDLLEFRKANGANQLRDDLRMTRLRIQSDVADLSKLISMSGNFVQARLDEFAKSETAVAMRHRRGMIRATAEFGLSCVFALASVVVPILSVVSLFWSRSVSDIVGKRKEQTKEIAKPRPIATLVRWRSEAVKSP